MQFSYGWEKLHKAIHSLCGQGSQSQRLINAISYSLIHITPENDLPEDMRAEFAKFIEQMTSTLAVGDEGTIQATVGSMGEVEISRAIKKIIDFYDTVCHHKDPF